MTATMFDHEQLDEITRFIFPTAKFKDLGPDARIVVMNMHLANLQIEATNNLAYVGVYQDLPNGHPLKDA